MKIGLNIIMLEDDTLDDLEKTLKWAHESGFTNCHLTNWIMDQFNDNYAKELKNLFNKYDMEITALWCGWHPPVIWNFTEGPSVLGIVPPEYRSTRTQNLIDGAKLARSLGIDDIITHLGFVPIDSCDPDYVGVVNQVRYISDELKKHNQNFLLETGQEPPLILRRLIEDVGNDNLFINYDPSNIMAYGNGNAIDGLDMLGGYIKGVHAKDGLYPTGGYELGKELPPGKGKVNFPKFISKLKEIGYDGALTIEHETDVDEETKKREIIETKVYLENLLKDN